MEQNFVLIAISTFLFAGASGNRCFVCQDNMFRGTPYQDFKCDERFDPARGLTLRCDTPCYVEYKKTAYKTYSWKRGCSENSTCEEIWDIDHWRRCCNHDECNDHTSADITDFPMKQCYECSSTMYHNDSHTKINGSCAGQPLTLDMEINRIDCNGFCFAEKKSVGSPEEYWITWTQGCKETCAERDDRYGDYHFCCNHHNLCNYNPRDLRVLYYGGSIIHRFDLVSVVVTFVLWACTWFD